MLGLTKRKPAAAFFALGKHPAFNDYFSLNEPSTLSEAMTLWIEKGVQEKEKKRKTLNGDKCETNGGIHTYRFWMQAGRREELALGIIRDSCDSMGRAFPLLIMAHGIVKEWYKSWHYIFQEWEPVFRELETAATSQYLDFQEFQARLKKIRFPEELAPSPPPCDDTGCPKGLLTPESILALFQHNQNQDAARIPASSLKAPGFSCDGKIVKNHFFSKPAIPASMFVGGIPEAPTLFIYSRPLRPKDFSDLFNLTQSCRTGPHDSRLMTK